MEYSVYDLIRIILRKWYVILITMCLMGGLAVIASQRSQAQAIQNYETYTTPPAAVTAPTGDTVAQYRYTYKLTDVSRYLAETQTKDAFLHAYAESAKTDSFDETAKPSIYNEATQALAHVEADFTALLTSDLTMRAAQAAADEAAVNVSLTNCLTVTQVNGSTLQLTVTGLDEDTAGTVLDAYMDALVSVGAEANSMEISAEQIYHSYYAVTTQDTSLSDLSQTVMQELEPTPINLVRTIGTAAAFAFLLSCFGILLYTFIRDTRPSAHQEKRKSDHMA